MEANKQLDLVDAWRWLERVWLEAKLNKDGHNQHPDLGAVVFAPRGLCHSLLRMNIMGIVDIGIYIAMCAVVNDALQGTGKRFLFPTTAEGAKQRALFCRHQIELLERGEHAHTDSSLGAGGGTVAQS